ncbi:hypothetical protein D299_gp169 [Escherichia phage HX01]|nr:hypothetical protein D299_gp169 [Escherichia phage HX01]
MFIHSSLSLNHNQNNLTQNRQAKTIRMNDYNLKSLKH